MDIESFTILSEQPPRMHPLHHRPAFVPYPRDIIGPQVTINCISVESTFLTKKMIIRDSKDHKVLKVRKELVDSMVVMEKMVKKEIDVRVSTFQLKE